MFEMCLLLGIGIITMIVISVMYWNEAVLRYDLALRESNEALEEAMNKTKEYAEALHELKHIVINDPGTDYTTKARIYALVKSIEE